MIIVAAFDSGKPLWQGARQSSRAACGRLIFYSFIERLTHHGEG
jgi:hypothetical protein